MKILNTIQIIFTLAGGFIGWLLGGIDGLIYSLLVLSVIDYVSGVMLAVVEKKVSSNVGFKGICRKILIFALVGVGNVLDLYLIKNGSVIRSAVVCFYISNEGISIIENAGKLGLPIPEKLKIILEDLNKEEKK